MCGSRYRTEWKDICWSHLDIWHSEKTLRSLTRNRHPIKNICFHITLFCIYWSLRVLGGVSSKVFQISRMTWGSSTLRFCGRDRAISLHLRGSAGGSCSPRLAVIGWRPPVFQILRATWASSRLRSRGGNRAFASNLRNSAGGSWSPQLAVIGCHNLTRQLIALTRNQLV